MTSRQRRGIITGGTWCVDRNRVVSSWPQEDGLAEYLGEERHGGGSGHNLAVDIKRLDPAMWVETVGLVGDDEEGRFLLSLAAADGIDHEQMHVSDEAGTHFTDAFVSRSSRRRTHIFNRGVADLLSPDHFNFERTKARILHLGLPGIHKRLDSPFGMDENGWVAVLRKARQAGLQTNLELASVEGDLLARLCQPCLPHLDFLIVNDFEIGAISGLVTLDSGQADVSACEKAARIVLERGAMDVVVVHSPRVAIAVTRDGRVVSKPSVNIPDALIVGANGAGDAFAAGMLYGLHEGWAIEDGLSLAHAAAATSLRSISTTTSVERSQACLELAAKWGWRSQPLPHSARAV
ncbi:MAG: carbohydrate kinase family protein [Phyllobacterium sp.]